MYMLHKYKCIKFIKYNSMAIAYIKFIAKYKHI